MGDFDWHEVGENGPATGLVVSFTRGYIGLIGETYEQLGEPDYIRFGTKVSPDGDELDFAIEKVPPDMEGARNVKNPTDTTTGVYSQRLIRVILEATGIDEEKLSFRARVWPDEEREARVVGALPIRGGS